MSDQPPYPYSSAQPGDPYRPSSPVGERPSTVTFAGWLTIVSSLLTAGLMVLGAVAVVAAREPAINAMMENPDVRDAVGDLQTARRISTGIAGFFVAMAVWAGVSALLGLMVLRRSRVARVLLVISAVLCALLTLLLALATLLPGVWTLACLAVVVLLFVGGAGDWFAGRPRRPGYGEPLSG